MHRPRWEAPACYAQATGLMAFTPVAKHEARSPVRSSRSTKFHFGFSHMHTTMACRLATLPPLSACGSTRSVFNTANTGAFEGMHITLKMPPPRLARAHAQHGLRPQPAAAPNRASPAASRSGPLLHRARSAARRPDVGLGGRSAGPARRPAAGRIRWERRERRQRRPPHRAARPCSATQQASKACSCTRTAVQPAQRVPHP